MATTFTLSSSSYDGRYLKLTCTQVKDIANNRSTINWVLEAVGGNVNYYYTGPTTVTINGTQVYYKARTGQHEFPCAKGNTSGSLVVNHNTNGSKTVSCSLSTAIYTQAVSTVSNNWTLDTLPRAAKLESVTDFNDEGNPTITYTNYLGNSVTNLYAYIYASDDSTILVQGKALSKTGSSYTYSLTDAERTVLRRAANTKNSLTLYFYISTIVNGTTYWSNRIVKTMNIVNATPEAVISLIDANDDTFALAGNRNTIIKGFSDVHYKIAATAKKEATITTYYATCENNRQTGDAGTFHNATTNSIKYSVVDSRGNTYENTDTSMSFVNYEPVTISQRVEIELVGETGAEISVQLSGTYYGVNFGAANNVLNAFYKIKEDSGNYSDWILVDIEPTYNTNAKTYQLNFNISELKYDKSYTIQCKVVDRLTYAHTTEYVAKLIPVFDWSKEDFNFNVPVKFQGEEMADIVIETGSNDRWKWRKYKSGVAECWARIGITVDVSNTWGSLYTSGMISDTNLSYPFEFASIPTLNVSLSTRSAGAILMIPGGAGSAIESTTKTGVLELARGTALNGGNYIFNYHAIGRWK